MTRWAFLTLFVLAALAALLSCPQPDAHAADTAAALWIWFNEGNPAADAPAETRYFRRVFTLDRPVTEAVLEITADNGYTVWVNGTEVGRGDNWMSLFRHDVKKHLVRGKNVLAVAARNEGGPAGLLVRLTYVSGGRAKQHLVSDGKWKAAKEAGKGWRNVAFDDSKWTAAKVLGPAGSTAPWNGVAGGGRVRPVAPRFSVAKGFRVEEAVANPGGRGPFSLVNMTFDGRGRLLVSQEGGPVLLCTGPDKKGVLQDVRPYCELVKNCQGMCWAKDALYLVGEGPKGTGLYRCRDSKGADRVDAAELIHRFVGGMGEHGPHGVVRGPDGFLYVMIGNHAWAHPPSLAGNSPLRRWPKGTMGPDQGKPNSTEDVLLPRQNDARGHAANILAPGGTVWRLAPDGSAMSLVTAGFRNAFDLAFSPAGELFTFDSDMEWDEGLPWYRAVRVCHCPPGADFLWRTGAANTPDYYLDSLPPVVETGRGSPVGLEFYDHFRFPQKYRGAYFMADWSLGIIYAVHLKRDGASYKAEVEKFCTGSPLNVTDLGVGPDGALYFTMGGRGTRGGVFRIVPEGGKAPEAGATITRRMLENPGGLPQPLAAWSRARAGAAIKEHEATHLLQQVARRETMRLVTPRDVRAALNLLQEFGPKPDAKLLVARAGDKEAELRAHAVWLLGVNGYREGRATLVKALKDKDALVRRRACEALIRAGIEPSVGDLWPLLGDRDRFVRTAARLVLQRIDPKKWMDRFEKEASDAVAWEAVVALCKTEHAIRYNEQVYVRLRHEPPTDTAGLLAYLRTVQLALLHAGTNEEASRAIAARCDKLFPHADWRVNRELAILLTHFSRKGQFGDSVPAKLMAALRASKDDRKQQIHYFYCLRLVKDGWTPKLKDELLSWYDATRDWRGGFSFTPFLENILRDARTILTADDVARLVAHGEQYPLAAAVVLRMASDDQLPPLAALGDLYARAAKAPGGQTRDLRAAIIGTLGKKGSPAAQAALRKIADADPGQRALVARSLSRHPTGANFPYLAAGLDTTDKAAVYALVEALKKCRARPKKDDPAPYRLLLRASRRLDPGNRWKAVEVLRHWTDGKQFGAEDGDWQKELGSWSRWFAQSFPKEPPLPDVAGTKLVESKYKFDELLAYLQKDGRTGDATRGRAVFTKAQCVKCHKFAKEGEGVGPDLTTLSKRFKRADILESIYYPSKVISDQYRSTTITTKKGVQFTGLAAVVGDTVTVLQSDGTKATLKKGQIEQQFASLVSVMPEKLLDELTKQEIADLFAFLESEPAK